MPYVMNADGTEEHRITAPSNAQDSPTWSPNSTRIAFERYGSGDNTYVYVVGADGTHERRITHGDWDMDPAWSPDDGRIAFARHLHRNNWEIYSMRPSGRDMTRLTNARGLDRYPAWSPDGSRIVVTRDRAGIPDIVVMRRDGAGQHFVTAGKKYESDPAWQSG